MIQENLKVLRLKKGMSQEELAVRIHVVRQTVSKWEKGLSVPDAQTLIQIAQALEVPVSAFLGFGRNNPGGKRGGHAANNGKKAGGNQHLSSGTVRSYSPQNPDYCDCYDPFGFCRNRSPSAFFYRIAASAAFGSQCNRRSRWGYRHSDSRYQLVCVRRGNGSLYLRTYRRRNFIAPIKTVTEHRAAAKRLLFCVSGRYDS